MSVTVSSLGEYSASVELLKTVGGKSAQEIVNVINKYNLTPAQFKDFTANMVGSGLEPWYSELGVPSAGYRVYTNVPVNPSAGSVAAEINSNVGATQQVLVKTPIETTLDQAGNVHASSGLTSVKTGLKSGANFIAKEVLPAVVAAGAGIRLGIKFDQALYNLMPNVWDSVGLSTLNPETWGSITADYPDGFLKSAFNALFVISPDGVTQQYVDERALAYMAKYMNENGFFDTGSSSGVTPGQDAGEGVESGSIYPKTVNFTIEDLNPLEPTYLYTDPLEQNETRIVAYFCKTASPSGAFVYNSATNHILIAFNQSVTLSNYGRTFFNKETGAYAGGSNLTLIDNYTYDNKTVYYITAIPTYTPAEGTTPIVQFSSPTTPDKSVAWLAVYGNTGGGGGVEGVTPQDGATLPDFSNCDTIDDYIDAIRYQYPDMYDDAVSQDWVNPETGDQEQTIFVPIGTPVEFMQNDEGEVIGDQPITDGEETGETQDDPAFDPSEYTEDPEDPDKPSLDEILDRLLEILTDILPSGYEDVDPDPGPDPGPDPRPEPNPDSKPDSDDPYNPANPDPTGGGSTPAVITPSGTASALWSVYNPSQAEINSFGAWLWSNNFIDQLLKLFNNPMQSIIGIHKIFASPQISGTGNIVVGYLDSGVSANIVSNQYTNVDCGSVSLQEQFGNVFDYTDTYIRLYLPFIGIVPLDTADVMRGVISIIYHVDVITGACLAEVEVSRDAAGGTIYQFAGDASVRYPLSSGSYMGIVAGIASIAGGIASAALTGGATLPMAAGAIVGGISNSKTQVQHSGSFSGNAGAMGCKVPYLIIERPQTMIADNYNRYTGIGSNKVVSVGEMTGYFRLAKVKTATVTGATKEELDEIRSILENGALM